MLRALLLSLMLALSGAEAGAQTPPAATPKSLGMPISTLPQRFNDAARRLEFGVRLVETECRTNRIKTCRYSIAPGVGLVAAALPDGRTLQDVALLIADSSGTMGAVNFLAAFLVLATILEPQADNAERAATLFALTPDGNIPENSTARLRSTRFTLRSVPGMTVMITAARE